MSHNVALTSQKPCKYNNKLECSETNGYNIPQDAINEVYVLLFFSSIKYCSSDILLKNINFINSVDRMTDSNIAETTCYSTNFPYVSYGLQNAVVVFFINTNVILHARLTYIRDFIFKLGRDIPIAKTPSKHR